ncbi:MAG: AMP phosphorylase [archaeon]
MKFVVKDMNIATGGPFIATLNEWDAERLDLHCGDRVRIQRGRRHTTAVVDVASERAVKKGRVGLFQEVIDVLGARNGDPAELRIEQKPKSVYYIKKKMDGEHLKAAEIDAIVHDIVANKLTDIELTYFVGASYTGIMSFSETVALTKSMIRNGDILKIRKYPIVDKHCIGGVPGNRTTMIIVPILAAAGLTVPKTSSRSITSPAGTADTMEVLAGVTFSVHDIRRIVKKTGACMVWGGAINLAPADDKIIRVEHPLSIDSRSQLLASIIAKKASVSATHLLVDIPVGTGAKIEKRHTALKLGSQFVRIGKSVGIKVRVMITDGSAPIGNGLGPALEARDVLYVLQNNPNMPPALMRKSVRMAGNMLEMAGKAARGKGEAMAKEILVSGRAYRKFVEIVREQGGRIPEKIMIGKHNFTVASKRDGRISNISNKYVARVARLAGAPADKGAGLYIHRQKGGIVRKGDLLCTVYSNSPDRLRFAKALTREKTLFVIKDGQHLEKL